MLRSPDQSHYEPTQVSRKNAVANLLHENCRYYRAENKAVCKIVQNVPINTLRMNLMIASHNGEFLFHRVAT